MGAPIRVSLAYVAPAPAAIPQPAKGRNTRHASVAAVGFEPTTLGL